MTFNNNAGFRHKIMTDITGFLKVEQINQLIKAATKPRNKLLLMIYAMTGRRASEGVRLKPKNIDWKEELILWDILKRKDINRLWIRTNRNLLISIKQYINEKGIQPDDYIFPSDRKKGYPLNRKTVYYHVRRIGKRAGINRVGNSWIHPHHFRHSFAINGARRIKNASDLVKLQMLMGHARIETTAYYLQFAQSELEPLINDMPDFSNGRLSKDDTKKVLNQLVRGNDDLMKLGNESLLKEELKKKEVGNIMDGVDTEL